MIRILLRCGFCACLAFVTLEVCARVDDYVSYGAPLWKPYNVEQIHEFDRHGRRGKPHARYRKWKLNELGFRGPDLKPDSIRIAVFGASETFGLYESPDHEYPRLLENELNKRSGEDRFNVVNAAYAGMPVFAMTPRVAEIAATVRPKVALIYATPANYIWLPWVKLEMNPMRQPPFDLRIKESLKNVAKQVIPDPVQNWIREKEIAAAVSEYGPVMDRIPEKNVERFTEDIRLLASELQARGIEPWLVTHAHRFHDPPTDEDKDMLVTWRKFYPMLSEQGFLDMERRMNDAVRRIAASQGYTLVDAARQIPPGSRNFADFTHFTNEGSSIMARVLADAVYPRFENCCAATAGIASKPQR